MYLEDSPFITMSCQHRQKMQGPEDDFGLKGENLYISWPCLQKGNENVQTFSHGDATNFVIADHKKEHSVGQCGCWCIEAFHEPLAVTHGLKKIEPKKNE